MTPTTANRAGAALVVLVVAAALPFVPASAAPPTAPFAAVQFGTNGCIEVGARPDPPYNQPKPNVVPAGYDVTTGYPPFGYDPTGYTQISGTNSCRYNFRNDAGVVIGSAYCVQWAEGQRSGTGYDPEPWDGTIRNAGFVRRILVDNWPATDAPAVPSTNATVINRQRSGTVAMAVHFFTDGIVLPPNYDASLFEVTRQIVAAALAAGPLPEPADPTPTISGPNGGDPNALIGPFVIGSNATGTVTVDVTGGDAFTDAAGTIPFTSGTGLAPGGSLWVRSATPGDITIHASGPVTADIGTMMVGDPAFRVQRMFLATPLVLTGKASKIVTVLPPGDPPGVSTLASAGVVQLGQAVFDVVTVSHLSGAATLQVTLYGPLPTVAGSCSGVDWTGAPTLTAFSAVAATNNGDSVTPSVEPVALGCYSFGATLQPATGPPIVHPPGDPDETLEVEPAIVPLAFSVTSLASANEIAPGESVSDRVTVQGFPAGRSITLTSTLYGPFPPDASGACTGVDWQRTPLPTVRSFSPVSLSGSQSYETPAVPLTASGCYSFGETVVHNLLTGGEEPVVRDLGIGTEVVLVTASASTTTATTPTTSPTPTTSVAAGPGSERELPFTGFDLRSWAALALLLFACGSCLAALAAHRRREIT